MQERLCSVTRQIFSLGEFEWKIEKQYQQIVERQGIGEKAVSPSSEREEP